MRLNSKRKRRPQSSLHLQNLLRLKIVSEKAMEVLVAVSSWSPKPRETLHLWKSVRSPWVRFFQPDLCLRCKTLLKSLRTALKSIRVKIGLKRSPVVSISWPSTRRPRMTANRKKRSKSKLSWRLKTISITNSSKLLQRMFSLLTKLRLTNLKTFLSTRSRSWVPISRILLETLVWKKTSLIMCRVWLTPV